MTPEQRAHRMLLREVMVRNGFEPYPKEWWHFMLEDEPFPNTYFDFPVEQKRTDVIEFEIQLAIDFEGMDSP